MARPVMGNKLFFKQQGEDIKSWLQAFADQDWRLPLINTQNESFLRNGNEMLEGMYPWRSIPGYAKHLNQIPDIPKIPPINNGPHPFLSYKAHINPPEIQSPNQLIPAPIDPYPS